MIDTSNLDCPVLLPISRPYDTIGDRRMRLLLQRLAALVAAEQLATHSDHARHQHQRQRLHQQLQLRQVQHEYVDWQADLGNGRPAG
jgi:hypothetical protein